MPFLSITSGGSLMPMWLPRLLLILSTPIGTFQDRHRHHDFRFLAVFALNVSRQQQVELLIGAAEFDVARSATES
jgi:hypothetical protein